MPNPDNEPQIPKNQSPITDDRTGLVSRDWYRFFLNLLNKANAGGGGGGSGTVTSVDVSGAATGLTTSGGPVTTSGTIALSGTLNVAHGGTAATTIAGARTSLDVPSTSGSGATGTWGISVTGNAGTVTNGVYTTGSYADPTWITSLSGSKVTGDIAGNAANVTGTVAIANGGTGQTTQQAALNALAGAVTAAQFLRGDGTNVTMSAIQVADVPTLNQNTTGTASNVTGVVAIANGGTGQTTKTDAFDALSPTTTKGDLIVSNGTDNIRLGVGTDTWVLTADSTQASGIKWAASSGAGLTISNDTSTATNLYPTFAAATSGTMSTIYTSNAKYLYKPSTGELTSPAVVASNGIFVNSLTISTSYTIPAGSSGMSAGTVSIASGVTVTVSSGSRWVVV